MECPVCERRKATRLALAEYINLRLITSKTESDEQGLKLDELLVGFL